MKFSKKKNPLITGDNRQVGLLPFLVYAHGRSFRDAAPVMLQLFLSSKWSKLFHILSHVTDHITCLIINMLYI